jgi:hypothetical protein
MGECDVVVKGIENGEARGWLRLGNGTFLSDRVSEPVISDPQLRAIAATPGQDLTFSCVPPGSGDRIGIDRDQDGFRDRDELDDGKDPADPTSFPGSAPLLVSTKSLILKDGTPPSKRRISFQASTKNAPDTARIMPPPAGGIGDPTLGGGTLTVYNSAGLTNDVVVVDLPAGGWSRVGKPTLKGYRFKGVAGPIKSIIVKADGITVKGGKDTWSYTLKEPRQGSVAVRLRLGSMDGWCTDAPALAQGKPPSTAKSDRPDLFKSERNAPAPAACPAIPSPASASGAFLD